MENDYYLESIRFTKETAKMSTSDIKLADYDFLHRIPTHLYKFRKKGKEGRINFYLGDRAIYTASLTKQKELGDEFEGITPATKRRILDSDAESLCKYYKEDIKNIIKNHLPNSTESQIETVFNVLLEEEFDEKAIIRRLKTIEGFKYDKRFERIISAIVYLFYKIGNELNGNSDFAKGMRMLMDINDNMGVFCMCDSYKNQNLWINFADNFEGYCIEYDFSNPCRSSKLIKLIKALYPVCYCNNKDDDWIKSLFESTIECIDFSNGGPSNIDDAASIFNHWCIKTICTKGLFLREEHEWRILSSANQAFTGPLISTVIVGHKINRIDFHLIKQYCDKNDYPMKITDVDYEKKEIIIREITENDINLINLRD